MKVYKSPCGISYFFTSHALVRMSQRSVNRLDVERVIDDQQITYYDPEGNCCFVSRLSNGRLLRVVVLKDSKPMLVKTVITPERGRGKYHEI